MKFTWLHISDFHFQENGRYDQSVILKALVESVERFCGEGRKPDLIFATGDLVYSGKATEYDLAKAWEHRAAILDKLESSRSL